MIFYTGLGYLVLPLFIAPFMVIGLILDKWIGLDVLGRRSSWLVLHSLMVLGAILVFVVGWYGNRKKVAEVTYEQTGPVTTFRPRHTLYWIRMEYWGPIGLAIYFVFVALRAYR
jgi:hypothetical protein